MVRNRHPHRHCGLFSLAVHHDGRRSGQVGLEEPKGTTETPKQEMP
ncbi:hypothetical protein JKG47_01990 [Acidithiobacillus sp. MC6.1]|nr:hypothetical protein [Acidithiobacillus sp. MC6.1]